MRKPIGIALVVAVLVLLGSTVLFWQKYRTATLDYTAVKSSEDAAQARYGEALNAIGEIQDSLATLGVGDATRPLLPGSPAAERGLSLLKGREALDRIALIKAGIQRTKDRIAELERRVHLGGVKLAGLEHVIVNLKATVAAREAMIAALTGRVDSLKTQLTVLDTKVSQGQGTISDQQQTIERQRQEMGTVLYVIGTRDELTKKGLAVANGGVLGFGRTLQPSGNPSDSLFDSIDTDVESIIPIPASKAKVISAQPTSSYSLLPVGQQLELHILEPKAFRTVKYVVIVKSS
jgi:uncharacterized coiled-coil protein SlyX